VEQGQPRDRVNLEARTSNINDTRRYDKVGIDCFQLPSQRTHPTCAEILSVAYSDHVGGGSLQSIYDGGFVAKNRHGMSVDIKTAASASAPTWNTYPNDSIARTSYLLEFLGHGSSSVVRTNHKDR
jgi:hypothetical protein